MPMLNENQANIATFVLVIIALFLLIPLHLLSCFLAGYVVFEIINGLTPHFEKFINGRRARLIVVTIISICVVSFLILGVGSLVGFIIHTAHDAAPLSQKVTKVLLELQTQLAVYLPGYMPNGIDELKNQGMDWLQDNSAVVQKASTNMLHNVVVMLVGMLLGVILSLYEGTETTDVPVFKKALIERISTLSSVFRNILFAQLKISSVNTVLSGLFLLVILPTFGVYLPFAKTLVTLTFILGLLPVLGNLMSNTLVVISGLSLSLPIAAVTLVYLIVIHKLEYFLNAKIVGSRIKAHIWEILIAMLFMESLFGVAGLIAAPIYYAYIKRELFKLGLI